MKTPEESSAAMERAVCEASLDGLVSGNPEVGGALVSTVDGFEVAARMSEAISPQKLAAMTSSLLALAEAIANESAAGSCRDLVIDASEGRVLLMDIPGAQRKLLLTVLCDARATLGSVLWAARNTRESIGKALGAGN